MKELSRLHAIVLGLGIMTGPVLVLTLQLNANNLIGNIPLWVAGIFLYIFGIWLIIKNAEDEK